MNSKLPAALILATLAAAVAFSALVPVAEAADIRQTVLTSADAGNTQAATLVTRNTYAMQCTGAACYRLSADAGLADCTLDPVLPPATTVAGGIVTPYVLDTGAYPYVRALALDAGNPDCRVFLRTKSLPIVR